MRVAIDAPQPRYRSITASGACTRIESLVVLLQGQGGSVLTEADVTSARAATPDWTGRSSEVTTPPGCEGPWPMLSAADVIVTHAGLNAVAEVAAARKAAVSIPNPPHEEQFTNHRRAVAHAGLAITLERLPSADKWPKRLRTALGTAARRG
jgi:UDP-N-acetylglucosamine--N-acetylmuramyl-(pentapeptide) pyrophosphoryl-undecaprenol N-acetylglucosamine transferase